MRLVDMAPEAGFEPATRRLTVACSTAELLRKNSVAAGGMTACEGASFGRAFPRRQGSNPRRARGGLGRNRTGIDGFAVRYIATLPPGRREERRCYTHGAPVGSSLARDRTAFDALGRYCL